ncbi:class I SAM-dependent methyltransferase [Aquabacterium sp.]|uniref:class I SAM-dependent methyltransferase n=1 Tax=Aquabacterium sp. TaxID=1872578 RepID=UPI0037836F49
MNDLHWLDPWLPLLAQQAAGRPLLELGCGSGLDTATLLQAGHAVTALDLDAAAVAQARDRAPAARLLCQDLRAPWPAPPGDAPAYGAVIASLSLHYFPWPETEALAQRVHDSLAPGGLLLCRLNSTRDTHYGATGHPEIAPHYYRVDGAPKRFFDEADVQRLFGHAGWHWLALDEVTIDRYEHPKLAWQLVAQKPPR